MRATLRLLKGGYAVDRTPRARPIRDAAHRILVEELGWVFLFGAALYAIEWWLIVRPMKPG